jgi:hypothetical protein
MRLKQNSGNAHSKPDKAQTIASPWYSTVTWPAHLKQPQCALKQNSGNAL